MSGAAAAVLLLLIGLAALAAATRLLALTTDVVAAAPPLACEEPALSAGGAPAKPMPPQRSLTPIGAVDDGYAVEFTSFRNDGIRKWWCFLGESGDWRGVALTAEASTRGGLSAGDGQDLALAISNDAGVDRIELARPGFAPQVVSLARADPTWLKDWSFWGDLSPIPHGGFLFARGTRLVLAKDGRLATRPMPVGLTPLSATGDPTAWLVARSNDRVAGGRIGGPLMLWREGDDAPTPIPGTWSRWLPAAVGLLWLRGDEAWSLLRADGTVEDLPADSGTAFGTEIAPDGSAELLITGDACGSDQAAGCDVRLVDPRSGAQLASLPGPGLLRWGSKGGLFISQPAPVLGQPPHIVLISGGEVREVALPN